MKRFQDLSMRQSLIARRPAPSFDQASAFQGTETGRRQIGAREPRASQRWRDLLGPRARLVPWVSESTDAMMRVSSCCRWSLQRWLWGSRSLRAGGTFAWSSPVLVRL